MIYEHWKGRLSAAEQRAYDDVLAAIMRRQERIPVKGVQPQELSLIHKAVYYDHPELFYITHAPSVQQTTGLFGSSVTFICKSIFSPGVIQTYQKRIEEIKAALTPAISSAANDYEKEKIVCDYLLRNLTYHIDNTLNQNAGTALVKGRAQCSGFAKAVKLLLDWIGIPCLIIDGEVNDPATRQRGPHAWNLVCIDGVWYHLDVTLMLGANMQKQEPFRYLYLNWTDAQMHALHVWTPIGYPLCNTEFVIPAGNGGRGQTPPPTGWQAPPARPQTPAPPRTSGGFGRATTPQTPPTRPQTPTRPQATTPQDSFGCGWSRPRGASPTAPKPTMPQTGSGMGTGYTPVTPRPSQPQPTPVTTPSATPQTPTRVRKTVTSLGQFRRDIANVYRAHLRMFEFVSTIPAKDSQELLNEVLQAALDEAKKQNLQVSINVTVSGDIVKVTLSW